MDDGRFHVHVLGMLLLVGDDDVDVVLATQAVVCHRQQAVHIGWQVDADDGSAFVDDKIEEAGVLVGEAVVILPPNRGGDQQVQRGDFFAPTQMVADRQPFRVLVEHGVDDMHEGFVGGEKAMPPSQQVAFQHAFHGVFAEHFHDAPVGRQFGSVRIFGEVFGDPEFLADFVNRTQLVGGVFIRPEHAEIAHIAFHDVAQEHAQRRGVGCVNLPWLVNLYAVVAEIRHPQCFFQLSAIGVGVVAHSSRTRRSQRTDFSIGRPFTVEQFFGFVAAHPFFQQFQVGGVFLNIRHRHLMRPPEAFNLVPVDLSRRTPAFR